jgi:hypothetical protein
MTVTQIMDIWPIAMYLSANDIQNRRSNSGAVDITLPQKIYSIGTAVQRIYDADSTDDTLPQKARYLYALCGKYGLQASVVTQTAGSVSPATPNVPIVPYQFNVAASGNLINEGESSVIITSFIGFNLLFVRNGIPQTTLTTESSYYSWNKETGLFTISPGAILGELFQIYAI